MNPHIPIEPAVTRRAIRTCPLCEATCGLVLELDDNRVLSTRGDPSDVFSKGYLCQKGTTLGELHEDPDRLRGPLVRDGDELRQVGWDEAFERAGELIRNVIAEDGPAATAVYVGNPTGHNFAAFTYFPLILKAMGTTNLYSPATMDQRPRELVNALMYGSGSTYAVPDIDRTELMVIVGANPMESNGSLATAPGWPRRLHAIRHRGGRIVVIDPIRTRTADLADVHLRPRVGSDAALLLSLLFSIVEQELVDLGTVAAYATGLEAAIENIRRFSPERTAAFTQIDPEVVRALAREIAVSPTACVYGRMGTSATEFGTIATWAIELINICTGNLDCPGGTMFPRPASGSANTRGKARYGRGFRYGAARTRVSGAPEILGELPTALLSEEIDTPGAGRYRALVTIAGNPVVSAPDSRRMSRSLSQLDAFIAIDPYVNDTTRHAHVILPPPSALQRSHFDHLFASWSVRNVANYSPATVALDNGQPSDWQIMCRLSAAIDGSGLPPDSVDDRLIRELIAHTCTQESSPISDRTVEDIMSALKPRTGPDRILDFRLRTGPYGDAFGARSSTIPGGLSLDALRDAPHGLDFGALEPRVPEVLRTPDGMIALAPTIVLNDLNRLEEALHRPGAELVLIGRRHLRSNNSWMHNVASLMAGKVRSGLHVSGQDAERRGIATGDSVRLRSATGEVEVQVEISDRVPPGVVSLPHGWLHSAAGVRLSVALTRPGVNANILTSTADRDVPSWTVAFNGVPVMIGVPVVSPE